MAHFIQQLLHAKEPLFSHGLAQMEKSSGNTAADVKLIGDIHERAYAVMRKLGLDPNDTTRDELWVALHGRIPKSILEKSSYAGLILGSSVFSFNEQDVKKNKKVTFASRTNDNMRQALVAELVRRYKKAGVAEQRILEWLEDAGVKMANQNSNQKGITK